jgi:hypothetical protein
MLVGLRADVGSKKKRKEKGTYGSERRSGRAFSWILDGLSKPIANKPLSRSG